MFNWLRRRRTPRRVLTLRSRGESSGATRVDFSELAPDVQTFLGQAAYLFMSTLGALIMLLAGALPLLLVFAPVAWLGWRWRQKRAAQRRAAEAARKKKAEGEPSA